MTTILWLVALIGVAPFMTGLVLLKRTSAPARVFPPLGSMLLCTLAFNLTFFWQELWLVIPKALTPGLHPTLFHNNHDWTGDAPIADLLQGTGALATLASGLAFAVLLAQARRASQTWRTFLFWMAFQGLFQSLSQLAIGTRVSGNDVGRALGYLHVGWIARMALLSLAIGAMALAGAWLARACPAPGARPRSRDFGSAMLLTGLAAVVLSVPFRLPRDMVEVVLIPVIVNLVGVGWLVLGAAMAGSGDRTAEESGRPGVLGPALALGALLLVFQLVLRPGVAF